MTIVLLLALVVAECTNGRIEDHALFPPRIHPLFSCSSSVRGPPRCRPSTATRTMPRDEVANAIVVGLRRFGENPDAYFAFWILAVFEPMHAWYVDACRNASLSSGSCAVWALELCGLARRLKRFDVAVALCESARSAQIDANRNGLMLEAMVQLATAYRDVRRYEDALQLLDRLYAVDGGRIPSRRAISLILQMKVDVLDCAGETASALLTHERVMEIARDEDRLSMLRKHVELLGRIVSREDDDVPSSVLDAMRELRARETETLLNAGPWVHALQLPQHFRPTEQPPTFGWPRWDAVGFGNLSAVRALLMAWSDRLEEELIKLATTGKLLRDTECLHAKLKTSFEGAKNHTARPMDASGWWGRFEVNGFWRSRDDTGCAVESPTACETLRSVRELGVRVVRAGYSAIAGETWIRPHFGTTNQQLKLHLGLVVPRRDGYESASTCPPVLRAAGHEQRWSRGNVLLFDDSWEHEVRNGCNSWRGIFQLVVGPVAS